MNQDPIFKSDSFLWLDVVNPTQAELDTLAREYGLHANSVQDCLEPEHLPKFERFDPQLFLILRSYDEACTPEADTVQELTRKLAIFCRTDRFVITVHRADLAFLKPIRDKWSVLGASPAAPGGPPQGALAQKLLADLIRGVLLTYDRPIDRGLTQLERLEMGVFGADGADPFEIKQGYFLKRQASVFRRMLHMSRDLLPKLSADYEGWGSLLQDLREEAEGLYFYVEEMTESINSLINLHLSLSNQRTTEASHRTSEVMRVLTIFSVFLLPLNLVTGIYGMNFEHMPELKWRFGYPMALLTMIVVIGSVYLWFRKKGWLKD